MKGYGRKLSDFSVKQGDGMMKIANGIRSTRRTTWYQPGNASGHSPHRRSAHSLVHWLLSSALLIAVGTAGTAMAAKEPIWKTKRVLKYSGSECAGVPNCLSVASSNLTLAGGQTQSFTLTCPAAQPHAWHWDSKQHEHVTVYSGNRTASTLTFVAANQASTPGSVLVYIGCSIAPADLSHTGEMTSRCGLPSKVLKPRG